MHTEKDSQIPSAYFVSASVRDGRHLLLNEACARMVLEALAGFRSRGKLRLYGFVLLPSRLRFLCLPMEGGIGRILDRFFEDTERRMQTVLQRRGRNFLMQSFYDSRDGCGSIWGKRILEPIPDAAAMGFTLTRMHAEPVSATWRLAATPPEYLYSSASFYAGKGAAIIELDDWRTEAAGSIGG